VATSTGHILFVWPYLELPGCCVTSVNLLSKQDTLRFRKLALFHTLVTSERTNGGHTSCLALSVGYCEFCFHCVVCGMCYRLSCYNCLRSYMSKKNSLMARGNMYF
jgi:hypothetical protein